MKLVAKRVEAVTLPESQRRMAAAWPIAWRKNNPSIEAIGVNWAEIST